MNFYQQTGPMALGSRLRRLSETVTENASRIFTFFGVPLEPKWFPVFYALSREEALPVTEIARRIDQSHPSVSQIVREMTRSGLTSSGKSPNDARVSLVRLTEKGRALLPVLETMYLNVGSAVEGLLAETTHNLWKAMDEFEFLLEKRDLYGRVVAGFKERESQLVEIVEYAPEYREDFFRLNQEWIETWFEMEEEDRNLLEHPEERILENGGRILFARFHGETVGTCALVKLTADRYAVAKMAVTAKARGKGIGWLLGQAILQKARELGAATLFIESNTLLEPAINLYYKLGFKKVVGPPSHYKRCNIQLELKLD